MAVGMAGAVITPNPAISSAFAREDTGCCTSSATRSYSNAPCSRLQFSHLSSPSLRLPPPLCRSGLSFMVSWHGRSHFGDVDFLRTVAGRHWQSRQSMAGRVQASLLGVGAPEALVIAVVALIVFGPKGLAEVARTLGKSLKAFQPTIQELQQVSREFKSTLEQEIGLDELRNPRPVDKPPTYQQQPPVQSPPPVRNGAPEPRAYSTEDYVRVTEEQAKALVPEDMRREAEAAAWGGIRPKKTTPAEETKGAVSEQNSPEGDSRVD